MGKEEKEKMETKWMKRFELLYNENQTKVIDRFMDFCRKHSCNRIAGMHILLEFVDYHANLTSLAEHVKDNAKAITDINQKLEGDTPKEPDKPQGMGSGIDSTSKE